MYCTTGCSHPQLVLIIISIFYLWWCHKYKWRHAAGEIQTEQHVPRVPAANSTRLESDRASEPDSPRVADAGPDPPPRAEPDFIPVSREAHLLLHLPDSLAAHNPPTLLHLSVTRRERGSQRIGSGRVGWWVQARIARQEEGWPTPQRRAARTHARGRPGRSSRPTGCGRSLCLAFRFYPPWGTNVQKIKTHEITLDFREFSLSSITNVRSITR